MIRSATIAYTAAAIVISSITLPIYAYAQDASTTSGTTYVEQAIVTQIVSDTPTIGVMSTPQTYTEVVMARIVSGAESGNTVQFSTSYVPGDGQRVSVDDRMYIARYSNVTSTSTTASYFYQSIDHYRIPALILFLVLFLGCVVFIGGKQGIRGLVALVGGICLIIFVLLPGAIHGYSPLLLSVIIASLIASVGAYITHGFNKMTTAAGIGMVLTIIVSTLFASLAVHIGYLSGVTDENTYNLLSVPEYGALNFQGLLLGGIIIGLLGVLYDAAIGQAVAVEELTRAAPNLSRKIIYGRAFRIGREHIGALVNTLILAYVGTSLPIFISYYGYSLFSSTYYSPVINQEWFVTEVIRMSVGGIGLMLTIPITTLVAVWMLVPRRDDTV